jgi:hypothetical protein
MIYFMTLSNAAYLRVKFKVKNSYSVHSSCSRRCRNTVNVVRMSGDLRLLMNCKHCCWTNSVKVPLYTQQL